MGKSSKNSPVIPRGNYSSLILFLCLLGETELEPRRTKRPRTLPGHGHGPEPPRCQLGRDLKPIPLPAAFPGPADGDCKEAHEGSEGALSRNPGPFSSSEHAF